MSKAFIVWQFAEKEAIAAFNSRAEADKYAEQLRGLNRMRFPHYDYEVLLGDPRDVSD